MRNKTAATATMVRLLENARYEVLPTASVEEQVLANVATSTALTVTASPSKGLEATLELAERLTTHGYTAVPHLAARMVRDRAELTRDLRAADLAGDRQGLRARWRRGPARRVPRRALDARGDQGARRAVLARRHHRLPGVAPDDQRRPHDPVDVGQAPLRHPRRQQPDLRPGADRHLGRADAQARHHDAAAARHPRPRRPHQAAHDGDQDRRGGVDPVPGQEQGTFARLAAPGGFTGERFLEKVAPALSPPEMLVEGLHVFTFNQVAATEEWRRDLLAQLTARV